MGSFHSLLERRCALRFKATGSAALEFWGLEALKDLFFHFSGLQCIEDFEIMEALNQRSRLKQDLSGKLFFVLP
jgi:hypothetical protein